MKVRIYKTPTAKNPNKVAVSIPQAVQEDEGIRQLTLTQEEILPPPKTLTDLFAQPTVVANPPVSAFKSVTESNLTPGFSMVVRPIGIKDEIVEPLPVEEVVIPSGYIHLDDESDWHIYNYGKAWTLTDRNFDVLPGEKRLPKRLRWNLIVKGRTFIPRFDEPVDSIRIYYRRISLIPEDFEWVDWVSIADDPVDFPFFGKYQFRAIPFHDDKPLPSIKEWEYSWEEPDTLTWSSIQLDHDSFQIRMEGIVGPSINEVEALENNRVLGRFRLRPNKEGRTEKSFVLDGVSQDKSPEIEYRFMRRSGHHRSFVSKAYQTLERNYARESIAMKVQKKGSKFLVNVQDPRDTLYSPINPLQPFSSQEWTRAIQTERSIAFLEITRHQDGEKRLYGRYMINITKEKEPRFLQAPPFDAKVKRVNRGFSFVFEDTQDFRDVANLDNPDLDKRLAYEFRLVFWTAGIEECLRSGSDYLYIKETPVLIRNKRSTYKFSYSVWKEEHPRKKWTGVIPMDISERNLLDHLRYGRSPNSYVLDSFPLPVEKTRNVNLIPGEWQVLYYYDDKTDELVEHPYYYFDIKVPTSSQLLLDKIEVFIQKKDDSISLGEYHPTDLISIVDFIGYYEERKIITKRTNFQKAFKVLPKIDNIKRVKEPVRNLVPPKVSTNTRKKRISVDSANRQINNAIVRKVESGTINYQIVLKFIDGQEKRLPLTVNISGRPKMPEEPPDNIGFTTGNKTLLPSTMQVPVAAVSTIASEIRQTPTAKKTTTKIGVFR